MSHPCPSPAPEAAPETSAHSIFFDSPAELAAYLRYDRLVRTGPLLLAVRAGYHPHQPWPGSALESARNVHATRPRTMVEITLRATADGTCVVLHDDVLGGSTTGFGRIEELPAGVVLDQRLLDGYGAVTPYRIREAGDFLAWAVRAGAVLWLDGRHVAPHVVVDLVREHRAEAQVVVTAHGRAALSAYRRLAPELVYFVPAHPDGPSTAEEICREAPDLGRLVGCAGAYLPDPEIARGLHGWNAPTRLDLTRYDAPLYDDELDPHLYRRAVETGSRILATTHFREVADLLGLTGWAPPGRS